MSAAREWPNFLCHPVQSSGHIKRLSGGNLVQFKANAEVIHIV